MKVEKINDLNKTMVINLLKNVNGLKLEDHIINNCHVLLNDKEDIMGTISYEKFNKYALIRYFVFKKNIIYNDLLSLYNNLETELKSQNITHTIAIINSDEVKEVFMFLGFIYTEKEKVYFDETIFTNTHYKDNDVYIKKII